MDACRACSGSGEGYYTTNDKCTACNGSGIEKQTALCANCNTDLDTDEKPVNQYCSNDCYDEHTEKWG